MNINNHLRRSAVLFPAFAAALAIAAVAFTIPGRMRNHFHASDSDFKKSPLYAAAEKGDRAEVVRLLDAGAKADEACSSQCKGWTPLMIASAEGHRDVADALLERGADPNAQNASGRTALQFAVRYDFYEIAESLLKSGADPNVRSSQGRDEDGHEKINSPMADALSRKNDTQMLRLLIMHGGDPNYNFWGFTPLIQAARHNDAELVKFLLKKGADPNHKKMGLTPLDIARRTNSKEAAELLAK
jgi:ankyrin repeat protein